MIILVFSSVEFLLQFLPLFLAMYYLTPFRYKNITLLIGSLAFYAYGDVRYLPFIFVSIIFHYIIGRVLTLRRGKNPIKDRQRKNHREDTKEKEYSKKVRKIVLVLVVCADVAALISFKYIPGLGLPLGISFYTFRMLSYLVDVYQDKVRAELRWIDFAAYASMFPQMVAGPIVSYEELRSTIKSRKMCLNQITDGMKVFIIGLVMKVLLADRIALLWNEIQTTGFISISTPLAWLGAISYSMQLYLDFYGYSLMAVGLGRMLGFELPENFNMPYMSTSIREFYRRWHITLGAWFRKYVYIPLGGNRKGVPRTVFNLLVVWLFTGIWHGNSINFLLWGITLWFFIILERLLSGHLPKTKWNVLGHLYVLFVIPLTWMIFAIPNLSELLIYFGRMSGTVEGISVNLGDFRKALGNYGGLLFASVLMCTPIVRRVYEWLKDHALGMVVLAVLFWWCVHQVMQAGNNPFMYFRF